MCLLATKAHCPLRCPFSVIFEHWKRCYLHSQILRKLPIIKAMYTLRFLYKYEDPLWAEVFNKKKTQKNVSLYDVVVDILAIYIITLT